MIGKFPIALFLKFKCRTMKAISLIVSQDIRYVRVEK